MQNLQQQELYLHDELNQIYNIKNNMHVVFFFRLQSTGLSVLGLGTVCTEQSKVRMSHRLASPSRKTGQHSLFYSFH